MSSPALGADGTVYVGANDAGVHAIDGATGKQRWAFKTGDTPCTSPAIGTDGTVYVGSLDSVYALDGATGKQRWAFKTFTSLYSAIGADGTVYVGATDHNVYAIGP